MANRIQFSEEQEAVIKMVNGPILLIAGPGSGKTAVLTERVAYLLENGYAKDDDIIAFTFTNKATNQMSSRIGKRLNRNHNVYISNFHSFTFRCLREYGIGEDLTVVIDKEKRRIIKDILKDKNYQNLETKNVVTEISRIKNMMPMREKIFGKRLEILDIYFTYEEYIEKSMKIDFDGMNLKFLELLNTDKEFRELIKNQYKYILVDEAQDINWIQYKILEILAEDHLNLFMVGDSNQSIYGFRGSDVKILEDFVTYHNATELHLTKNFRSTPEIVNAYNNLISYNNNRFNKLLTTNNPHGIEPIVRKEYTISRAIDAVTTIIKNKLKEGYNYEDFLILFRENRNGKPYDVGMNLKGIPHYLYGQGFLEYIEINKFLGYCKLILNHQDNEAFQEVCNFPKRGIGDVTVAGIRLASKMRNKSYYEIAKEMPQFSSFIEIINSLSETYINFGFDVLFEEIINVLDIKKISKSDYDFKRRMKNLDILRGMAEEFSKSTNKDDLLAFINMLAMEPPKESYNNVVSLMTIHQSKGLEAKIVFLIDASEDFMPGKGKSRDIDEERRIFYVALSRAKNEFYAFYYEKIDNNDSHRSIKSRFIEEMNIYNNVSSDVVRK